MRRLLRFQSFLPWKTISAPSKVHSHTSLCNACKCISSLVGSRLKREETATYSSEPRIDTSSIISPALSPPRRTNMTLVGSAVYSGDSSKGDVTPAAEQADLLNEEGPEDVDRQEDASTSLSKCFLIIHSVSKRQNIGNLLRSATAFGVTEVCIIGSRKFSTFGSHGASNYVPVRSFATLADCCKHLKEAEKCEIIGVEIMDGAQLIETHPFKGPTAFVLGNEGSGLSESQVKHCDSFVYISQYGPGTASLNVYVAASIVLHHYALWAGYKERSRTGGKFDLGEKPLRTAPRGMALLTWEEMKAEQDRRRLKREANALEDGSNGDGAEEPIGRRTEEAGGSVSEQA